MDNHDVFGNKSQTLPVQGHKKKPLGKFRTLFDYFDLDIFGNLPTAGRTRMPVLAPYSGAIPQKMISFDEAYTRQETNSIVHFYVDDRRFLRLFRHPEKYLPFLQRCALVIEPDLSQYANMPFALRYAHAWLNRAMAAWLQSKGVKIVSNVTWSRKDSYEYSIEGRPRNSILAVNCMGIYQHDESMYMWREGYKGVVLPLNPTIIIRYGSCMPDERKDISIYFPNKNIGRHRNGSKW